MRSLINSLIENDTFTLTPIPKNREVVEVVGGRGGSSIKSDRIQKLHAEGVREWRSHEPLGGSGGMLPQEILKTRTPQMLFPAFWRVNFKQKSTAKISKKIAKLVIYSHYFLMLGIKFHIQLIYSACQTLCAW